MTNGRILGSINLPTTSSAIGVWHIDEAFLNIKNGTWPTAPVPQPYYAWEADFGVTTVGADGVTVDASPVSGNRVKSWTSTNGRLTISQATAANMPVYYVPTHGKPYIQMIGNGTVQYLQSAASLVDFNNLQQMTLGVAMRRPGAYNGYRNDVYAGFNYGWGGIPSLLNISGTPATRYGGDSITGGKSASLGATYDPFGETTIFGTFSTTATSQASANAATSTGRIYLNGTLNASDTTTTTTTTTTNTTIPFNVGLTPDTSSSGVKQYYGVYLYKQELTASQVSASHADISGRFFSWTTLPVTGSVGWWDASRVDGATTGGSRVTANNGAIDTWIDLSGSSRNATQSTSGNRPVRQNAFNGTNGQAAIALNGTSQFFEAAWSNYTDLTLFVVAKNTNASALGSRIFSQSDATLTDNVQTPSTNYTPVAVSSGAGSTAIISTDTAGNIIMGLNITNAVPLLVIHRKTGTTGSNTIAGSTVSGTIGSVTRTLTKLTLGKNTNGSDGYWAGSYYEVIAFPRALTAGEETLMKNYIQSKWDVS